MIGAGLLFGFRLTAVKKKKREYAMRRWKEMEGDGRRWDWGDGGGV